MRAIFFGSPDFAVPCLDALTEVAEVVLVVSQPDRPAGRGLSLRPPAVKARALELGLEVLQPTKVRTAEFAEQLRSCRADVGVVVAYGRILPRAVLEAPRLGCVNVHASILPRWRGAAPIHWAIVHGDEETGVSLMQMDEGMDTGPVLALERTPIDPRENAGELFARLSTMGADLLRRELPRFSMGELEPTSQDGALATHAPMLEKRFGHVDFGAPAKSVHDQLRGMNPWPGAYTDLHGKRIKLHRARASTLDAGDAAPGTILGADADGIRVACASGVLYIEELQLAGKKRMDVARFLAGNPLNPGDVFDAPPSEE